MDLLQKPATSAPVSSRRDRLAVCFFGTWMITGLFVDGWAHEHNKPETFFTPWHGLLYSGFGAAVLWFAWDGRRQREAGAPAQVSTDRLTTVGLTLFIVGAIGDFVWHEVFGIEVDLEALLSPTHLALMTGGILMVSMPVRAAWSEPGDPSPSFSSFAPTLVSTTLTVAVLAFFLQWASPFESGAYSTWVEPYLASTRADVGNDLRGLFQTWGLASILITNALLMGALLLLVRRWRPPQGSCTLLLTTVTVAATGLQSFERAPLVLAALIAGLVADSLLDRPRLLAMATPAALWLSFFAVHKMAWGLGWSVDLWLGVTVLASLSGAGLAALAGLMTPTAVPPAPAAPTGST